GRSRNTQAAVRGLRSASSDEQLERTGVSQAGVCRFRGWQAELAERQHQPVRFIGRILTVVYREGQFIVAGVFLRCAVDPLCRPSRFDEYVEQLPGEAHGLFGWHRGNSDVGCRKLTQSGEKLGALNLLQPAMVREVPCAISE